MLISLASHAIPSRLAAHQTPLDRCEQRRPKLLALRIHTSQDTTDTFDFAVFELKGIKGEPPSLGHLRCPRSGGSLFFVLDCECILINKRAASSI